MATPKPKPTLYKGDTKKPTPYKGDTKKPAPYKSDTKKPAPYVGEKSTTKISKLPIDEQARMDAALADLMKKRAEESKRTGMWPNYSTN
jgi:hypothetical protein